MKKIRKCPICNSSRVKKLNGTIKCMKCGYLNERKNIYLYNKRDRLS
jgi:hypothetical protein